MKSSSSCASCNKVIEPLDDTVRDGRTVAASLLERQRLDPRFIDQAWAPKTGEAADQSWVKAIEMVRIGGSRYHSSRYLELRYEGFFYSKHDNVEDTFFFLNEKPDDGVFRVLDEFFDAPRNWSKTL